MPPAAAIAPVVAGVSLVVGSLALVAVAGGGGETSAVPSPPAAPSTTEASTTTAQGRPLLDPLDPEAAERFLAAWSASLEGTYVTVGRFERVRDDDRVLEGSMYLAQRPPDRVEAAFGSLDAVLAGHRVACAEDDAQQVRCRTADAARGADADARSELDRLRGLVTETDAEVVAPYRVSDVGGGCFVLTLRFGLPAAPYGDRARFCFDSASGARVRSEVQREGGVVDRFTVDQLAVEVTDADLVRPAPDVLLSLLGS